MQLDLETIIVLLVFGVLTWAQMKMASDIGLTDAEFVAAVSSNFGDSESAGADDIEQTAFGIAGWDSLFDGLEFV